MQARITKRLVDATQASDRPVFVWDTDVRGFGLKVTPAGKKSYIFQYRLDGGRSPTRRYTIGPHGPFTPDQARTAAEGLRVQVSNKVDPARARSELREKERLVESTAKEGPKTFGPLAEKFIKRECVKLARGREIESIIRRHILPHWADRPVAELRKSDGWNLTDPLVDAGKGEAARKLHEVIKRVFNWLLDRDEIDASPFATWKAKDVSPKARRTRVLKDDEIRALWSVAYDVGYPYGSMLQLLLLTGQRRNEVAGMRWQELDLEAQPPEGWSGSRWAEWTIPAERSKNRKPHLVPLSEAALNFITRMPRFTGPYVLSSTSGHRPISGFSMFKTRIDALSGVEGWRLHDLRRTCRTGLSKLGVPDTVAEHVLNHQQDELRKIYDQHDYALEKRDALDRWARRVNEIVAPPPANVVPLSATY